MLKSEYLERFKRLKEANASFLLHGDRLIVEVLPKEEIKMGLITIAVDPKSIKNQTTQHLPTLVVVLQAGEGYEDEDGNDVPMPYSQGEVLLVSEPGLRPYSQFPGISELVSNKIALTRESEVHMSWPSIEAYEAYKAALNG